MSELKTLACPTCGAPLSITGEEAEVQCSFCGNRVAVPAELRTQHQPPPQPQVIEMPQVVVNLGNLASVPNYYPTRRRSGGCAGAFVGLFITFIVLIIIGVTVFTQNMTSTGISGVMTAIATGMPFQAVIGSAVAPPLSFGGSGTGTGLFSEAWRITVDSKDNVFVSDNKTGTIQKFDADGNYLDTWQVQRTNKNGPVCLSADRKGNIYACQDGVIIKFDSSGSVIGKYSGQGFPTDYFNDVALTVDGTMVAESGLGQDDLVKLDTKGKQTKRISKFVSSQTDDTVSFVNIAVDGLGNVYAADESSMYILKFGSDGRYINRFGGKGTDAGQFDGIVDKIAVDRKGNVYVPDFKGIQVFDSDGHFIKTIQVPNFSGMYAFAINDKNQIYYVGTDNKIYRLDAASSD